MVFVWVFRFFLSLSFSLCCFLFVCFFCPLSRGDHLVLYSIVCETAAEYLKFSGRLYFFCPSACPACHQLRSVFRFNFDLCQCWSVMCPSVHGKLNMNTQKRRVSKQTSKRAFSDWWLILNWCFIEQYQIRVVRFFGRKHLIVVAVAIAVAVSMNAKTVECERFDSHISFDKLSTTVIWFTSTSAHHNKQKKKNRQYNMSHTFGYHLNTLFDLHGWLTNKCPQHFSNWIIWVSAGC